MELYQMMDEFEGKGEVDFHIGGSQKSSMLNLI
jgi:hypothetical protein